MKRIAIVAILLGALVASGVAVAVVEIAPFEESIIYGQGLGGSVADLRATDGDSYDVRSTNAGIFAGFLANYPTAGTRVHLVVRAQPDCGLTLIAANGSSSTTVLSLRVGSAWIDGVVPVPAGTRQIRAYCREIGNQVTTFQTDQLTLR